MREERASEEEITIKNQNDGGLIMEIKDMKLEDIEARMSEIKELMNDESADIDALTKEVDEMEVRKAEIEKDIESRKSLMDKLATGEVGTVIAEPQITERGVEKMTEMEKRAQALVDNGTVEMRTVLSTGTIAKPVEANGINDLAPIASDIVDDVKAVSLSGNGAYVVAYKDDEAEAADVTDGNAIGGTGASFKTVQVDPAEWGVLDTVSKQVKKMTPVNYLAAVEDSAINALRAKASAKIVAAVKASTLKEEKFSVALDASYIRNLVLNFRAIKGKGEVVLYIAQADLATLGAVRGTNEKKPCYEISFDAGTTLAGTIKDGGTAVKFRVVDSLATGEQLFGQPQTIEMPMWDGYSIETDEGGQYFANNLIAVKGLQTAGVDLCAYHGMQVINQAAQG